MLRRLLSRLDEFSIGLLVALFFSVFFLLVERGVIDIPLLKTIDLKILDKKFAFKEGNPKGDEVVIVGIDERSISRIGKWPWKGNIFARTLKELQRLDAKLVAFDIVFTAQIDETLTNAFKEVRSNVNNDPEVYGKTGLLKVLSKVEDQYRGDKEFAEAIKEFKDVVLIYKFIKHDELALKEGAIMEYASDLKGNIINFSGSLKDLKIKRAAGFRQSKQTVRDAVGDSGFMNINLDWDGVSRTIPLVYRFKDDIYAAFSIVIVNKFLEKSGRQTFLKNTLKDGLSLNVAGREIPIDEEGMLRINYYGRGGKFKTFSLIDLLERKIDPEKIKNKIVLVGATAPILHDLKATPFEPVTPGVEVHATVIDNLLYGNFISRKEAGLVAFELLIVLLFGAIMGLVLRTFPLWAGLPVMFALSGSYVAFDVFYIFQKGKLLVLYLPLLELVTLYIVLAVFKYSVVEARSKDIKNKFKHFVDDAVVEEMVEQKDLNLGTVRKNLTVLFCDIRGFAEISEKLEPSILEKILNKHMTNMTEAIIENRGTIDKYMGDAVMAIFGAPLDLDDHPYFACRAAFRMIERLLPLNREFTEEGLPHIRVGIGISTGEVLVGNLGSEHLFNYTVLGNEVNVASRIEELTREYDTNIIISENTLKSLGDRAVVRNIGEVNVKGIEKSIKIFALLGVKGLTE